MFLRKVIVLIYCVTSFDAGYTQQVNFIKYSVYDGLVANPVRRIYQDSKGFIWIGTGEGLSRYDGYQFTNFTTANGLSHDFINSIFEVDGKLLIGENNGSIDVIQNSIVQRTFKVTSAVNSISVYKDRVLLTTDHTGFHEYKDDTIISIPQERTGANLGHFVAINDSLLLSDGLDHQVILYKNDLRVHELVKDMEGLFFYSLLQDSKKRVWACTSQGLKLLHVQPDKKPSVSLAPLPKEFNISPLMNAHVTSIVEAIDGSFWIGTMKGLVHIFPGGKFHTYYEKDGLPSAIIHALYKDKENNLWIGTSLGLAKWVAKNNVQFYNAVDGAFRNDVVSIYRLNDSKVILGTARGLQQFHVDTKEIKNINGASDGYVVPIQNTSPLLLVHYAGKIGIFDSLNDIIIPHQNLDIPLPGIVSSARHPDGTIYTGTFGGLFAIKGTSLIKILPYRITSVIIDTEGSIWAGTWNNGLYKVSSKVGPSTSYIVDDLTSLVKDNSIRGLYVDRQANIWVGTRYTGAFRLSSIKGEQYDVRHFDRKAGLMSNWIGCFAETIAGDIWLGSYQGIDKLIQTSQGYRVFNFSKTVNFFAEVKKIVPVGDHEWVCLANTGIAFFKDENLHLTPALKPSIFSVSLGVLENKLTIFSPSKNISLKPNQNAARFEFGAPGFVNERQVLYSYRLKGSNDTSWSKAGNIHEASYASLSPGHYTFEVKTIGWNGKYGIPASFSFTIAAPFWKQWWFIGLGILVIALLFYALYRYRIRQLLRLQNVRNNIATDLHDDIGSSLTNISILSELGSKNLAQPEKAQPFLQRISEEVQASSQAMDDIIWSVNSRNDSLQETMARMRRYAAELFDNSKTDCHLQLDENSGNKKLSMEQRRDLYLVYKEALTNIHKHADANNVWINVDQNQNHIFMNIRDDGKGFNTDIISHRNGLKNLRSRVEKWDGKIKIEAIENGGTTINIKIPLRD